MTNRIWLPRKIRNDSNLQREFGEESFRERERQELSKMQLKNKYEEKICSVCGNPFIPKTRFNVNHQLRCNKCIHAELLARTNRTSCSQCGRRSKRLVLSHDGVKMICSFCKKGETRMMREIKEAQKRKTLPEDYFREKEMI